MARPEPKCPIRFGEPCSLCVPGANGPQDCQLVALVRDDPELLELQQQMRQEKRSAGHGRRT
ncbi:DUF6767 domain-containing protein [Corynebacterium gerontici]|uniref:DUF6767 domain-containing protein n=1 Tax=Corynebacterium gerontici TaxID=2079234 RepID=UPI000F4DCBEE|nr:DUF6767 domain-containing protein [Corynebacterium gerontici]